MSDLMSSKEETLKNFMQEQFCFDELKKVGLFDESVNRDDYQKQSDRICEYFGLKNIYEYGAFEIRAHVSDGGRSNFITEIRSIYEED